MVLSLQLHVPYILTCKSDFREYKIMWKSGFWLIGATYVKFFYSPQKMDFQCFDAFTVQLNVEYNLITYLF